MCLNEVKCDFPCKLPGFYSVRSLSINNEKNRGGVIVFFKQQLWPAVFNMDTRKDQVWFEIIHFPGIKFGALYITPSDSPYFSDQSFSDIHEKSLEGSDLVVFGDLNARMGDLSKFSNSDMSLQYAANCDAVLNSNGRILSSLCITCGITPSNHAIFNGKYFKGGYTFKKRTTGYRSWIGFLYR